jgi:hypothetical protein
MTGIASWDPERELNRDPNARPADDDAAGWLRFYAGGFEEADGVNRGWGRGRWRYHGCCQSCHAQQVADKLERLQFENAYLRIVVAKRAVVLRSHSDVSGST